jgi:NADH:ubiquinone oxidoreductase subunit 6 (subunit J)
MMSWVFSGITLAAVLMATFVGHMRVAILSLWVAGLGVGAVYLTLGAEFLAIVQWIVSTLVTISFLFFAVMFGEYDPPVTKTTSKALFVQALSLALGCVFAILMGLISNHLPNGPQTEFPDGSDLKVLGRVLTQQNLLSLEVLALTLFLVLVGGGVVARSEGEESS